MSQSSEQTRVVAVRNWYAAILVHKVTVTSNDGQEVEPDYSGSLILVRATSEDKAKSEAQRFAAAEEDEYENVDGEPVTWRFVDVLDVRRVDPRLKNGSEIYSWLMSEAVFSHIRSEF